jgi:ABC-type sugar transport system ATPase subunit
MKQQQVPVYAGYGLTKSFGGLKAVDDVSIELVSGNVLALVGDNGAGKSTLLKMLAGSLTPDEGSIVLDGVEVHLHSPRVARHLGVETVYQDLALADTLDVVQNVCSGRELTRFGFLRRAEMTRRTEELLETLRIQVPNVFSQISFLSGGQRQGCAISRAVGWGSRVLLFDEPTAALGVAERSNVLALIKRLRDRGIGILVISHSLPDVFEVADRVMVLRHGEHIATVAANSVEPSDVVAMITGLTSDQTRRMDA